MVRFLQHASRVADRFARAVCMLAGIVLVASVLGIVILRYGFGVGFIELQNLASYAFAVFVIFALPVCMAQDGHVRVEVLSERLSPRYRVWSEGLALVLLLIPVFALTIISYWPSLSYSWAIRERALETGGLPGIFLIKTALPLAAFLMIIQGIAAFLRRREAEYGVPPLPGDPPSPASSGTG
ncbi:TRAP transporter small permease subunit [Saliniramus fredricksonii]|nr:TRAP transporter small permease subunit [Saliniramus fredricksonii]